jgi:hypothetical protein
MSATAVTSVMLYWILHIVCQFYSVIPNEWQKPQLVWQVWCFNKQVHRPCHLLVMCYGNLTFLCILYWVSLDIVSTVLGAHEAPNFLFRLCYLCQCWYNIGQSSPESYVKPHIPQHAKEHIYIKLARHLWVTRCPSEPGICNLKYVKSHSVNFL